MDNNTFEIFFDHVRNVIFLKNNTNSFSEKVYISLTDCETDLNVWMWWAIFGPNQIFEYNLPFFYYENAKEFKINILTEKKELLYQKHFIIKPLQKTISFKSKNLFDVTYAAWEDLVYKKSHDFKMYNNDVIYDLGANVGIFSRWCLMQNVDYVYAFEPDKENVENLKITFQNDKNIEIIDKAILDQDIKQNFYIYEHSVSNSLFKDFGESIEVDCIHLENYIYNNNLKRPTIIKCDIEGAEYRFINSLSSSFFDTVRVFILEFHLIDDKSKTFLFEMISKLLNLKYSVRLSKNTSMSTDRGELIFEKL